jgi:hypothetical protein
MLFWISVISRFLKGTVTLFAFAVILSFPVWGELTYWLFCMAIGASLYRDALLIDKRPVEATCRVILVLFSPLFVMNIILARPTAHMDITRGTRAKLTYRLNFLTLFTFLCFKFGLRRIRFTPCDPFSIQFGSAFSTLRTSTASTWLHFKQLFWLLDTAFGTAFHITLQYLTANIIVHGAGGVKCL